MLPQGAPEGMENFMEMLQEMSPKRKKKRTVKVSEARRILMEQELEKLIDHEDVTGDALERVEKLGIIFLDEIDKIAGERGPTGGGGPDVSREGVQRDLLPIVEGSNVQTKYGMVKTDHVLFIAAGAFHVSKPSDLIPELQGRFPIRVELKPLTEEDFVRIMTEPENALTKQYAALVEAEGATLDVHGRRDRRSRAHRGAGQPAHGEHRRPAPAHGDDDAARRRPLRAAGPRHRTHRRQRGARARAAHGRSWRTRICGGTFSEHAPRTPRHFLAIPDFTRAELGALFDLAERMRRGEYTAQAAGRQVAGDDLHEGVDPDPGVVRGRGRGSSAATRSSCRRATSSSDAGSRSPTRRGCSRATSTAS